MTTLERLLNGEFIHPGTWYGAIFYAVVFLTLAWVGFRSLRITLAQLEGSLLDRTSVRFLRRMGGALIWVLAVILYANVIPELRAFGTALLAGASVASVLVGLAAQSTLGNMIAGVSLLMYRPISNRGLRAIDRSGRRANRQDEYLTLGYTAIKTQENNEIVVLNSVMASQAIIKSA